MNTILKMASRNIWRNRRRTLITAGSILFAVVFAIAINAFQVGAWDSMINGIVKSYYGFAQIHQKGYWEEQTLDNSFEFTSELKSQLAENQSVTGLLPRIEGFALVAYENNTNVRQIIGTDPEMEKKLSGLDELVVKGSYLRPNDDGILIADTLAKELKVSVGDTLILIGQGFQGANAVGKYPIRGLVKFFMPQMKELIYMSLPQAQYFFAAENRLTSLILLTDQPQAINKTAAQLNQQLDTTQTYEVMTWEALIPDLLQARELDTGGNKITLGVLYLIIAFGIFGTILMMVKERQYEFGVLTSIGMRRWKLSLMVLAETLTIGLIGVLAGMVVAFPIVYYFHINPVDMASFGEGAAESYEQFGIPSTVPFTLNPTVFISEAITVFVMLVVLAAYPMFQISKLKPLEAMRN